MEKNINYSYINKESVITSLRKMQEFEKDLDNLFSDYDLSLRENTERTYRKSSDPFFKIVE